MIVINDSYAIRSDETQWALCVRVKPSKSYPDGWRSRKFFTSLGSLRSALHGILLRTSDYSSLEDLERNANEISDLIDKRLEASECLSIKN
jgi:hypothetical protein